MCNFALKRLKAEQSCGWQFSLLVQGLVPVILHLKAANSNLWSLQVWRLIFWMNVNLRSAEMPSSERPPAKIRATANLGLAIGLATIWRLRSFLTCTRSWRAWLGHCCTGAPGHDLLACPHYKTGRARSRSRAFKERGLLPSVQWDQRMVQWPAGKYTSAAQDSNWNTHQSNLTVYLHVQLFFPGWCTKPMHAAQQASCFQNYLPCEYWMLHQWKAYLHNLWCSYLQRRWEGV